MGRSVRYHTVKVTSRCMEYPVQNPWSSSPELKHTEIKMNGSNTIIRQGEMG
jgi:hypothetical protein